jgi:hypothetical protein
MPSASSSRPTDAANLTRQQLDELDALLQRMLALPVHLPEESSASFDHPTAAAPVSLLEPLAEATEPLLAPLEERIEPSLTYRTELPTLSDARLANPCDRDLEAETEEPVPVWQWPLLGINQAFDYVVGGLGSTGRWLCRPAGRTFLGWAGLACLAAAFALLVLDWVRWNW